MDRTSKTPAKPRARTHPEPTMASADYDNVASTPGVRNDAIIIRRSEVVRVLVPSDDGDMPPLLAAFTAASDYIAEHAEREGRIHLGWTYAGDKFYAGFGTDEVEER